MIMSRLNLWYKSISKKDFVYKLQHSSALHDCQLKKVVISVNMNQTIQDVKQILVGLNAAELIAGQKPITYCAKKSVAAFKLRKDMILGCKVTLRKNNLFNLLDVLIFLVLPKVNDFYGLKDEKSKPITDISVGLKDLSVFPQVSNSSSLFAKRLGATLTFVTESKSQLAKALIFSSFQIPRK